MWTKRGRTATWASAWLVFVCFALLVPRTIGGRPAARQGDPADAKKVHIYLRDFELRAIPSTHRHQRPSGVASTAASKPTDPNSADADTPEVQAQRVVDAFSHLLTESFRKSGYTVTLQGVGSPSEGVQLRGVFAEPDDQNRIRRAILGAGAPGPTFLLYVGVFNLARPDQPLYERAPVQQEDSRYGPVISLNAYVPMVKYEVPKDPSEADIRKICRQIVSQLTMLLTRNPYAVSP